MSTVADNGSAALEHFDDYVNERGAQARYMMGISIDDD